jgi:hypothetical protein
VHMLASLHKATSVRAGMEDRELIMEETSIYVSGVDGSVSMGT